MALRRACDHVFECYHFEQVTFAFKLLDNTLCDLVQLKQVEQVFSTNLLSLTVSLVSAQIIETCVDHVLLKLACLMSLR